MRTTSITLLLSIVFACLPAYGQQADYAPGVVLVKFDDQALPNVTRPELYLLLRIT